MKRRQDQQRRRGVSNLPRRVLTPSWNRRNKQGTKRTTTAKTRQVLGRPVCDRGAIPRTLVQSNVVRSRLIILINEEINEANWMVSNSAKLDRRTKQHTQFGVSANNGSRDMARTKSWRKKKVTKRIGW